MTARKKGEKHLTLRIDRELHKALTEAAKWERRSMHGYILATLEAQLVRDGFIEFDPDPDGMLDGLTV